MNDQELTSGVQDFFADTNGGGGKTGGVVGGIGAWILHLVVFAFAIYSGYHGISATARFHSDSGLGMMAGIIGILVIEFVLIGLYLAFFNRRITGGSQKVAAAATAGLGFILSCMGIVGDSQMQAGIAVSGWLNAYLTWGLPIAPALMALGAAVVMATEPKHLRLMAQAVKEEDFQETKHAKTIAAKSANLFVAQQLANMQLNAKMDAARYLLAAHKTPEVQRAIQQSAHANLPELMRSIGVDLPYGTVIEGQAIEPLPPIQATASTPQAARPSFRDRMFNRRPAAVQPAPQSQSELVNAILAAVDSGRISLDAVLAAIERGERVDAAMSESTHSAHAAATHPSAGQGQGNGPAAKRVGPAGGSTGADFR